jgi:hypothetical protein
VTRRRSAVKVDCGKVGGRVTEKIREKMGEYLCLRAGNINLMEKTAQKGDS